MGAGLYSITTRSPGEILTANKYNLDHQNHVDNQNAEMTDDYSTNAAQMQAATDPYPAGAVSLATSLAGELERLRYVIAQITGQAQWYIDPSASLVKFTGMVSFFALVACPTGWTEYTGLRGKYVVGLVASGTLEGGAGTALIDQENRPAGQHQHDPLSGASKIIDFVGSGASTDRLGTGSLDYRQAASTGGVVGGAVNGTPAPYVQLLACKKD